MEGGVSNFNKHTQKYNYCKEYWVLIEEFIKEVAKNQECEREYR